MFPSVHVRLIFLDTFIMFQYFLHGLQINSIKHAIYALTYNLQFFYRVIVKLTKTCLVGLLKTICQRKARPLGAYNVTFIKIDSVMSIDCNVYEVSLLNKQK